MRRPLLPLVATAIACAAVPWAAAAAQGGVVDGVVVGSLLQEPAAAVAVELRGATTTESAVTDSAGAFRFDRLPPGTYAVRTTARGPARFVYVGQADTVTVRVERAPDLGMGFYPEGGPRDSEGDVLELIDAVLTTASDVPGVSDFPDRAVRFETASGAGDLARALRRLLPEGQAVPVQVVHEDPFLYHITWPVMGPVEGQAARYRRTSYLMRVFERDGCSRVAVSWITETRGTRERTWRAAEDGPNAPPLVARLVNAEGTPCR